MPPIYLPPQARRVSWASLAITGRDALITGAAVLGVVLMLAAWAA